VRVDAGKRTQGVGVTMQRKESKTVSGNEEGAEVRNMGRHAKNCRKKKNELQEKLAVSMAGPQFPDRGEGKRLKGAKL